MHSMKKFFAAWKQFGQWMAHAVGMLIFAVLYMVLFAPLALVLKLSGRHFLPRFTGEEKTYFLPREKIEPTMDFLKRQW